MSASTFTINSKGQWLNGNAAASYTRVLAAGCPTGGISGKGAGRTRKEQEDLYRGWINRWPGYNLAAPPGRSLHEKGDALDLETGTAAQRWMCAGGDYHKVRAGEKLRAHAYGWYRTVPSEPWHFQYFPARDTRAAADLKARLSALGYSSVAAYQRARGLTADGKAGPLTWTRLLQDASARSAPKPTPTPTPSPEEDDMQLNDRIPMTAWATPTDPTPSVSVADALAAAAEMLMVPTASGAQRLDILVGQVADRQARIEAKLDQLLAGREV